MLCYNTNKEKLEDSVTLIHILLANGLFVNTLFQKILKYVIFPILKFTYRWLYMNFIKLSVRVSMMLYSTEVPEYFKDFFRTTDTMAVTLLAIVLATLIFGIVRLAALNKDLNSKKGRRGNFANYYHTDGVITGVEEENYSVTLYKDEKKYKKSRLSSEYKYDDILGKGTVDKGRLIMAMYEKGEDGQKGHLDGSYLLNTSDKPKETNITRYRVTYEFKAEGFDEPFAGEFLSYVKDDTIEKGRSVDVSYNPKRPNANFTARSAPIGC